MKQILRILFPIWFDIEEINNCVDEEVNGIASRNFELSQNEDEYKKVIQEIRTKIK